MLKNIYGLGLVASLCFSTPVFADDNGNSDQPEDDAGSAQQLHDGERAQALSDQEQKAIDQAQEQFSQEQSELHASNQTQTQAANSDTASAMRAQVAQDQASMEQNLKAGKNVEAHEDAARLSRDQRLLKEAESNEYRNENSLHEYHEPHEEVGRRRLSEKTPMQQPSSDPAASSSDSSSLQKYQVSPNGEDNSNPNNW
jgi:hypothetical protein